METGSKRILNLEVNILDPVKVRPDEPTGTHTLTNSSFIRCKPIYLFPGSTSSARCQVLVWPLSIPPATLCLS
jgi:hypothetical protein